MNKKNLMRVFGILLVVALCAGFASCSSDDDENGDNQKYASLIVGSWQRLYEEDYDGNGSLVATYYADEDEEYDLYNKDYTCFVDGESFRWSISGGTLTIRDAGGTENYGIVKLDESTLVLKTNGKGHYEIVYFARVK